MNSFDPVTHTYTINGRPVPSVTQVLQNVGIIDPRWYTEHGRARGQAVHAACHYFDEDDLDWATLDPMIKPYVRAYERFKQETCFVPNLIEHKVFNNTYMFAGTLDRVGLMGKGWAIIDLKSGAIEPWCALQLAGYHICLPPETIRHGIQRYGVQLKNDETYKLYHFRDPNDRNIFLSAVSVTNWKLNNGGANVTNESSIAA